MHFDNSSKENLKSKQKTLQHGKVVTEFYSQVNSSCICVPCTYKELKLQNLPGLAPLPDVNPQENTQICLAEVGKIVARNAAPIMALQGKNVIEIDHTVRIRERADQFNFEDTANQIERMVKQQEESLIKMASKQIRDTGRLYHVKESNSVEYDMNETEV
ncbi:peptidyl-prolyl cis-trans isomerase-like 6 [Elysia marginata]|uniref:Peptidyl-prolyl cis-trans isomerase-like 6 n=1 Tax=Elysia marginata TaxID=1093978 RepID=A0AAV4HFH5_9GAST|nr:peptidyl-prolyl cis-trans isomerase-like 6 [Elysia marginata]